MTWTKWWPRRASGLPPGQRLLSTMPRFADDPTRPPPAVPDDPSIEVVFRGRTDRIRLADWTHDPAEVVADFHCVTTWSVRGLRWRGVRLRDVLGDELGDALGDERPPFARVIGGDGAAARFVIDDLLGPDVLLATHLDGEPLSLRHGAPIRLVTPGHYGYKHIKHVVRIELCDDPPRGRHGAKEHLRGRVDLEERHERLPNSLLRPAYRLVIIPTAVLAERALRRAETRSVERTS